VAKTFSGKEMVKILRTFLGILELAEIEEEKFRKVI